jgi:hypothetical protein
MMEAATTTLRTVPFIQTSEAMKGIMPTSRIGQFPEKADVGKTGLKSKIMAANSAANVYCRARRLWKIVSIAPSPMANLTTVSYPET